MKSIILVLLLSMQFAAAFTQNFSPISGEEGLSAIQNGFVIVRLHVNNGKKEYLEQQLSDRELRPKDRIYLEKQYNDYTLSRENYIKKTMYAFKHWFGLCPVYFYYDFDQKKIVNGVLPKGIFLNENGLYDPNLLPVGDNYLVIARKESDQSITASSGLKILDPSGNVVPPPFPQPKTPSFISIWFKSGNPKAKNDEYYDQELETIITKWTTSIKTLNSPK